MFEDDFYGIIYNLYIFAYSSIFIYGPPSRIALYCILFMLFVLRHTQERTIASSQAPAAVTGAFNEAGVSKNKRRLPHTPQPPQQTAATMPSRPELQLEYAKIY